MPGERVTFWFPDEETDAVQFSGETNQPADSAENARTLLRSRRLNAARRTASRVLGIDADNLGAHQIYSLALLASGDAVGALAAARRAQSLASNDPAGRALVWLHQAAAGPTETVVEEMRRDSRSPEAERKAFTGLVRDLGAAGAAEAAGAACVALSQWAPESAETLGLQGNQLLAAGRRDETESAYRQAHEAAPDTPIYLTSLGWMAWQRRRLREARDRWCEALRQDLNYAPAADSLGTMMTWAVALGSVGVTLIAAFITALPTLVGQPQNDRMFWMTLAAPFLAATSAKPLHRLAAMGILPSLSPAMSQLAQGNPAGTRWIAGIIGLVGALVIHSLQAWIEIALHPALWDDRWKGAATVTVITTYLAIALIWSSVKTHRADQVAPDRILAEGADA